VDDETCEDAGSDPEAVDDETCEDAGDGPEGESRMAGDLERGSSAGNDTDGGSRTSDDPD